MSVVLVVVGVGVGGLVVSFTFSRKLTIGLESSGSESRGRVDDVVSDLFRGHGGSVVGRSFILEDFGGSFFMSELRSLFFKDAELGF